MLFHQLPGLQIAFFRHTPVSHPFYLYLKNLLQWGIDNKGIFISMIRNILSIAVLIFSWLAGNFAAASDFNDSEKILVDHIRPHPRLLHHNNFSNKKAVHILLSDPDDIRRKLEEYLIEKGYKKHWKSFWLIDSLSFEWQNWLNLRCRYTYTKEGATINFKWQELDWGIIDEDGKKETEKGFTYLKKAGKIKIENDQKLLFKKILKKLRKKKHKGISNLWDTLTDDTDSRLLINQSSNTIRFILRQNEEKFDWCFDICGLEPGNTAEGSTTGCP